MKIDERTSRDAHTSGGGEIPPCAGLTSNALPKAQSTTSAESSQTGVSTQITPPESFPMLRKPNASAHWYVLRATYGREKQAYDYMTSQGITTFYPTIKTVKLIDGKRRKVTESRFPNIFFAYGTEAEIKTYVYNNTHLSYLRFYYRPASIDGTENKSPLTVPKRQMESLKIICAAEAEDIIVSPLPIAKFEKGQLVRVTDGAFKGVVGRVARYLGQQRVAVDVDNVLTVCTAYVPSAFLKKITK